MKLLPKDIKSMYMTQKPVSLLDFLSCFSGSASNELKIFRILLQNRLR